MSMWITTSAGLAAAGIASLAQGAVFNPAMFPSSNPSSYGTLVASLDIATTSYNFPFSGSFTNSGYVDEFGSIVLDKTQLVSRVYQVTAATVLTQGADTITLNPGDLAFEYTIRLVQASTNTVQSMKEFQVGLLNFVGGPKMDGSAIKGRGFVSPTGGVATPVGGSAGDLESIGSFGASHDWQWAVDSASQLHNSDTIRLLMFSEPRTVIEGLGNFIAPPGQQAGVDPLASGAPVLIPAVPAPGAMALTGLAGLLALPRRRGR